jgi:hypothetical protein
MPHFLVDGKSIYDKLRKPRFHLITFSDGQSDYQKEKGEIESEYSLLVDHYVVPLYPHVAEIFGTDKPFNLLLRPDNYVGFISLETSLNRLRAYLNEFIKHS